MDRKVIILPNQTDHAVHLCRLYDKQDEFENRPLEVIKKQRGGMFDSRFPV
jgi:hypothetical protein